jgi:hypothetical protein
MKLNFKRSTFIGIVLIGIVSLGIAVSANHNKPLAASEKSISAQANKVISNEWNLDITGIDFTTSTRDQKFAKVAFSMINNSSLDKELSAEGKIIAFVGISGKIYKIDMKRSLAQSYTTTKADRKKMDPEYKLGKFKFTIGFLVDSGEENFAKVIYQDGNGNNIDIPVQGIAPTTTAINTNGR